LAKMGKGGEHRFSPCLFRVALLRDILSNFQKIDSGISPAGLEQA
jgi:hypothetical protein